ncbi:MAG: hypothetical protein QOI24_1180 [Acidobacteriota bacterium]|nr:hypothetical protein [Acidobacteriota bacterium]
MDRFLTARRAVIAAAFVAFAAAILATLVGGVPVPQVHDEQSFLLAGDTYAHGRLTNPPHPMWPWLETFHVIQQPTYMSKYPPAQGALLAIGELAGLPVAGMWLAAALAAAAVTWMLLAWLPLRWSVAGGVLFALHPVMLAWSHSYWGAAAAAAGSALTVGAARRLLLVPRVADSLLLGAGIVILAFSRPAEGFFLVCSLFVISAAMRLLPWRALIPAALIVVCGLGFLLYDNWRVTGNPLLLPWQLYARQYESTPPLPFMRTQTLRYRHEMMRRISVEVAGDAYREQQTLPGFLRALRPKLGMLANTAFQVVPTSVETSSTAKSAALAVVALLAEVVLLVPLLRAGTAWRQDRTLRPVFAAAAFVLVFAILPGVIPQPHYAAPLAPLLILIWLSALRQFPSPRVLLTAIGVIWIAGAAVFYMQLARRTYWFDDVAPRLKVTKRLLATPGKHLVIVRYGPSHNAHSEWVANAADIDASRIVWAHDLGDNSPLLRYFADRRVLYLEVSPGARPRSVARSE